jgi:hypothetical protein
MVSENGAESGIIRPAGKHGSTLFPIPETILALMMRLRDAAVRRSGSHTGKVAEMRASEIQLKMDIRSGALIPQERAEAVCAQWAGKVRAALGSVPARSSRDVMLRKKIEAEIDDALRRVCDSKFGSEDETAALGDTLDLEAIQADDAG